MTRLDSLISMVDTSKLVKDHAPGVTGEQVKDIIEFGHIHFSLAYPGTPTKNKVATVIVPGFTDIVHTVQITVDKPGSLKNHLCCITCLDPKNRIHCAATIAALVVEMAEMPPPKKTTDCPGCGEELS